MDPDTTIRDLLSELESREPDETRIADLVDALDQWAERGGHLPRLPREATAPHDAGHTLVWYGAMDRDREALAYGLSLLLKKYGPPVG